MKKHVTLLALLALGSGIALAQSSKRTTAYNALNDFRSYKEVDALKKAKDNIDAASLNLETGVEAKTWKYRGDIYLESFVYALSKEREKLSDITDANKKTMVSYANTSAADLNTAADSYLKIKEFDKKKIYTEDVDKILPLIQSHLDNKGTADYNAKKATEAAVSFEKSYEISKIIGHPDTAVLNNAALAYRVSGDLPKAKATYQKLVDMGFGKGKTVSILANMMITEKDTASAGKVITQGRKRYPNDMDLLTTETNLFLMAKKNKEALANLKQVIEKNPNDAQLNLVVGSVFDNLANPKDEKGNELTAPAEADEYFKQSELYYKKAIELKPDYFDALYNLGALFNNQGVKQFNKSNTIKDVAMYNKESQKAEDTFKKALPFLEKAHTLNPKDRNTMLALKQLYGKTGQTEKYEKMVQELKGN
jgi:tetratricopeptide (TPR) repeat protein